MRDNFLKLNNSETEYLIVGSKHQMSKTDIDYIVIRDSHIAPSSKARNRGNLGVIFESDMSPKFQISLTLKCTYSEIRNIGKIRKYLTKDATQLVITKLNDFTSPLYTLIDVYWLPGKQRIYYKILVLKHSMENTLIFV